MNYYNEIDPYCAAWLQNLMDAGHIAPGVVDTRSIEDVRPDELAGYTQCHFFAGIGVWSLALRSAGWPDSRRAWTGSCPCQPFSAAGKGAGFADERHLWPAWQHLINQCRPAVIFGEQVASKAVDPWIDLVHADMEGMGYAFGCVPFPSAGVGAPHIRDRTFWLADAERERGCCGELGNENAENAWVTSEAMQLGDAGSARLEGRRQGVEPSQGHREGATGPATASGSSGRLADANSHRSQQGREATASAGYGHTVVADGGVDRLRWTGPLNGMWEAADWLRCRDGKWRPVEPKPQPLVDGSAESMGRVRPEVIAKIEDEIDAEPMESQVRRAEVLRALQDALTAEAKSCWAIGGLPQLHEAPFLLAFLRQLQEQGWEIEKGRALPREEVEAGSVRVLRDGQEAAGTPRQRGLDGQHPGELADAVHFLSSLLARHVASAWADAYRAYAPIGFPLEHGATSRVGRLRAYGNAISAPAAEAFIRSYCEARGLIDFTTSAKDQRHA